MRAVVAVVIGALMAVSCSSGGGSSDVNADVTVFAAASLNAAFNELGEAYMAANPDGDVTLSFAGSSDLATQIIEGAPADVFASADLANMARLVDAGGVAGEARVFATNVTEIIVEAGNPKAITSVADLAATDLVVVQCAPEVPCGAYAEQVVAKTGANVTPKSFEGNVGGVVTKVMLGEADAGIVYRTDVLAAGDRADGVTIPADVNVVAEYPIAATTNASNPAGADRFVEFVSSDAGQAILASYGFGSA